MSQMFIYSIIVLYLVHSHFLHEDKGERETLHWAICLCSTTAILSREIVWWGIGRTVEIDESVTGRKTERVARGVAALVIHRALVECHDI